MSQIEKWREDEKIQLAFLNNYRMVDIIKASGLSKSSCYRLKRDIVFQQILQERKDALMQQALQKMQEYIMKDIDLLQDAIENPEKYSQVRINGIQVLMNQYRDWKFSVDFAKRVTDMEASRNTQERF